MEQRPDQVTWPQRRTAGARTCKRQALTWRALSHHLRARCPAVPGLMGSRLVYALGVRPLPLPSRPFLWLSAQQADCLNRPHILWMCRGCPLREAQQQRTSL